MSKKNESTLDTYYGMDPLFQESMSNSEKEVELHRFYLFDRKKEDNPMVPFLYAYTNDSDISKIFRATRNPDLFIYKHSKEPIDVVADIEHKHPGIRLRQTKLKSRSPEDPTKTVDVPIVLTCEEELKVVAVQDDLYNIVGARKCMEDMTVLSTGLNYALKMLGYFDIYRFMCQMQYIDTKLSYFYEGVGTIYGMDGMEPGPLPNIIPDEFSVFMLLYGNTLKV